MLTIKETYEDYNGESRTETLYFNLTKAEIAKIQLKENANFIEYMQRLLEKRQINELFLFIEDLVRKAYGVKSLDGSRFQKSQQITEDFEQSPAFSNVVMRLIESPDEMQKFIAAVVPKDLLRSDSDTEIIDVSTEVTTA